MTGEGHDDVGVAGKQFARNIFAVVGAALVGAHAVVVAGTFIVEWQGQIVLAAGIARQRMGCEHHAVVGMGLDHVAGPADHVVAWAEFERDRQPLGAVRGSEGAIGVAGAHQLLVIGAAERSRVGHLLLVRREALVEIDRRMVGSTAAVRLVVVARQKRIGDLAIELA
ncbi:hypothetical protein D9M69_603790 [compost metagenome]